MFEKPNACIASKQIQYENKDRSVGCGGVWLGHITILRARMQAIFGEK